MSTRSLRTSALNIALCHFMLCGVLAGAVLFLSMGYGLSDAYHVPTWWFVALDRMLQLFEAPVVVVLRFLFRPTARFNPPGFFTIDLVDSVNFFVVIGLCALWSVGFGYLAAYAVRRLKTGKPG